MLIIFIFGNMFISIMVQVKFDRHIIYTMCVLDSVLKSRMFCISGDYNIYSQFQFTATMP